MLLAFCIVEERPSQSLLLSLVSIVGIGAPLFDSVNATTNKPLNTTAAAQPLHRQSAVTILGAVAKCLYIYMMHTLV